MVQFKEAVLVTLLQLWKVLLSCYVNVADSYGKQ